MPAGDKRLSKLQLDTAHVEGAGHDPVRVLPPLQRHSNPIEPSEVSPELAPLLDQLPNIDRFLRKLGIEPEPIFANGDLQRSQWKLLAIGLLITEPELTLQQIADRVGKHRGTIYRFKFLVNLHEKLSESQKLEMLDTMATGFKTADHADKSTPHAFEAWIDNDD